MTHPIAGAHPTPAGPGQDALLEGLTPEQSQAVRHGPGPLLLIAGPGAGKTKTLIHRIARLLQTGAAQPWEILAVTFSVRAAGELRLRLADLLGEQVARGVTAATFHSICARMLREHASVFGRTENYTVYDQTDVRRVIEWLLSDQQRGQIQQALADYGQPAAAEVLAEISLAKNRLLSPDSYQQQARHTAAPLIAAVWREAEIELQRSNAWDFDDLLTHAVRLLAEHPHRLAFYRQRWRWLVVDEYQDTNEAQSVLVALLAGAGGNVCCVGDDDQCVAEGTEVTMADGSRKAGRDDQAGRAGALELRPRVTCGPHESRARFDARRRPAFGSGSKAAETITTTPEHTHFAGFLASALPKAAFFVYLMWRQGSRLSCWARRGRVLDRTYRLPVRACSPRPGRTRRRRLGRLRLTISESRRPASPRRRSPRRYGLPTIAVRGRGRQRTATTSIVVAASAHRPAVRAPATPSRTRSSPSRGAGPRVRTAASTSRRPERCSPATASRGTSSTSTLCAARSGATRAHRLAVQRQRPGRAADTLEATRTTASAIPVAGQARALGVRHRCDATTARCWRSQR